MLVLLDWPCILDLNVFTSTRTSFCLSNKETLMAGSSLMSVPCCCQFPQPSMRKFHHLLSKTLFSCSTWIYTPYDWLKTHVDCLKSAWRGYASGLVQLKGRVAVHSWYHPHSQMTKTSSPKSCSCITPFPPDEAHWRMELGGRYLIQCFDYVSISHFSVCFNCGSWWCFLYIELAGYVHSFVGIDHQDGKTLLSMQVIGTVRKWKCKPTTLSVVSTNNPYDSGSRLKNTLGYEVPYNSATHSLAHKSEAAEIDHDFDFWIWLCSGQAM